MGHDSTLLVLGGPLGGRGLVVVVVALTLAMVHMSVLFNRWNNAFYTALQDKNHALFFQQLIGLSWLVVLIVFFAVYQLYLSQMLEIRWRRWLTERYLRAWLADGAYYRMQLVAHETDNPDQRIAEDVHLLISHTLTLVVGGLRALVTLVAFVAILWALSGTLTVPLRGVVLHYAARLHGMGGDLVRDRRHLAHSLDWPPLVRLNYDKQRCEADFRFGLVRFRENTEGSGALPWRGGRAPWFSGTVRGGGDELVGRHAPSEAADLLHFGLPTSGLDFPVACRGAALLQRRSYSRVGSYKPSALSVQVQASLSIFIDSYKVIAEWCAVVERLSGFEQALDRVRIRRRLAMASGAPTETPHGI